MILAFASLAFIITISMALCNTTGPHNKPKLNKQESMLLSKHLPFLNTSRHIAEDQTRGEEVPEDILNIINFHSFLI